jgi:hypothetical protein
MAQAVGREPKLEQAGLAGRGRGATVLKFVFTIHFLSVVNVASLNWFPPFPTGFFLAVDATLSSNNPNPNN